MTENKRKKLLCFPVYGFPVHDCTQEQNCSPYFSSIIWKCKWPFLSRKVDEIEKYCSHTNVTSQFSFQKYPSPANIWKGLPLAPSSLGSKPPKLERPFLWKRTCYVLLNKTLQLSWTSKTHSHVIRSCTLKSWEIYLPVAPSKKLFCSHGVKTNL